MNGLKQTLLVSLFLLLVVAGSRVCEAAIAVPQSAGLRFDAFVADAELNDFTAQWAGMLDRVTSNGTRPHGTELVELSPLFSTSTVPSDTPNAPEVDSVSSPLSGATALPPSATGIGSSSGGWAISPQFPVLFACDLQVSLAGEGKVVLPADPPYRWFRPPRYYAR